VTRQHPELVTEPRCQSAKVKERSWPDPAGGHHPQVSCSRQRPSGQGRVGIEQGSQLSNGNTPASSGCASRSLSGSGPVLVRIRELVSQRGFGAVLTDAICSLPKVATDLAPMWQLRT
jgi:hypothetical protein